jgi:hypothetical protein
LSQAAAYHARCLESFGRRLVLRECTESFNPWRKGAKLVADGDG